MVRELREHELFSISGGDCDCRRCREMSELADDIVDFFEGVWDGLNDGL